MRIGYIFLTMKPRPQSLLIRMSSSASADVDAAAAAAGTLQRANSTKTIASSFKRKLGGNEVFSSQCHDANGNMNVLTGLTLLTRHAVDEGEARCLFR